MDNGTGEFQGERLRLRLPWSESCLGEGGGAFLAQGRVPHFWTLFPASTGGELPPLYLGVDTWPLLASQAPYFLIWKWNVSVDHLTLERVVIFNTTTLTGLALNGKREYYSEGLPFKARYVT